MKSKPLPLRFRKATEKHLGLLLKTQEVATRDLHARARCTEEALKGLLLHCGRYVKKHRAWCVYLPRGEPYWITGHAWLVSDGESDIEITFLGWDPEDQRWVSDIEFESWLSSEPLYLEVLAGRVLETVRRRRKE